MDQSLKSTKLMPLEYGHRVAVILKGYPRLSETFITQELFSLQKKGVDITIISLRNPTDEEVHPIHKKIKVPISYLPEYLYQAPSRVLKGWWKARSLPGYSLAFRKWLRDFFRDPTPNRIRRWGQALILTHELDNDIRHLHAHFIHTPASVAHYTALISDRSWSVSAHAKDIWLTPNWEKREKLLDCKWAVTCTAYGKKHLDHLNPTKVSLSYHGLDLSLLPKPPSLRSSRTGDDPNDPIQFLSVGRAVSKKGYDILLNALALLPADFNWHWTHIGRGEHLHVLKVQSQSLGLSKKISWLGAQAQNQVFKAYQYSDLFLLPCRIARNGDRDGLPNVLMEAASQELCCITTNVAAITEFIRHKKTGWIIEPEAPEALKEAILNLSRSPQLRICLGKESRNTLLNAFNHQSNFDELCKKFTLPNLDTTKCE